MAKRQSILTALPLFIVILIDGMGLGILFPVLNMIVLRPSYSLLPLNTPLSEREFIYGLSIAVFAFCWLFGAPILSDLSDRSGRKKPLLLSLAGTALGYFLSAIAVIFHSIALLLIGRIIDGFTAGSQSIAQAAIIDLSTSETKARNLGYIIFFSSIGFIVGPIVGGVLSDNNLVSWFSPTMPFYFATLISLANMFLLQFLFKETFYKTGKVKIQFSRAIGLFKDAFVHKNIRYLSITLLLLQFSWSAFFSFITVYYTQLLNFSSEQISFYLAINGIGFGIGSGYLIGKLSHYFRLKTIISISTALLTLLYLGVVLFVFPSYAWSTVIFIGTAVALATVGIMNMYSNQVDADHQGWAMGIVNAVSSMAWSITTLLTGYFAHLEKHLVMIIAFVCMALTFILVACFREKPLQTISSDEEKQTEDR